MMLFFRKKTAKVCRSNFNNHLYFLCILHMGPPQVKCRILISSIFYAMNFRRDIFQKCSKLNSSFSKNVRNSLHHYTMPTFRIDNQFINFCVVLLQAKKSTELRLKWTAHLKNWFEHWTVMILPLGTNPWPNTKLSKNFLTESKFHTKWLLNLDLVELFLQEISFWPISKFIKGMNGWKVVALLTILDQQVQNLLELGMVLLDNMFDHYQILKKYAKILPYICIFVGNYIIECLILQCEFIWLMDCDFKGSLPGSVVDIAMPMAQFTFANCIRNLVMVPSVSIFF